jgi:cobalt-precorrin 5A hydrolase/precorrin-3B C17-methyltransferase
MKTSILYITENGRLVAEKLKDLQPDAEILKYAPARAAELWSSSDALIFIMATGIVVRTIAPLLKDKKTDSAVVVLDEQGKFAISLVSGHLGGANDLAKKIAGFLKGEAVITTASDVNDLPSIDLWARDNNLAIENWDALPVVGTRYVNNGGLRIFCEPDRELPPQFLRVSDPRFADAIVSNLRDVYANAPRCGITGEGCSTEACRVKVQVLLRPLNLVAGIGCNKGTSFEEIEAAVRETLEQHNLAFASLASVATIDIKGNEPGLCSFAEKYGLAFTTFTAHQLNEVPNCERSETVFKATGAYAVADPAALLASGTGTLLIPKQKRGNVTVAVAEIKSEVRSKKSEDSKGKIYVVGTGPGSMRHITPAAQDAIRNSDVIVGYGTYLDLIPELLKGKNVVSTGMTQEVDRCRKAIELASENKIVSVISGGDPGVYAMAGLVFEVLRSKESGVRSKEEQDTSHLTPHSSLSVEVIPGISALNAAAARLGAPLMHDFACISLSDRLTPWDMIAKRLHAAASADFVIVLYNPRSKGRAGHISRARAIIAQYRAGTTPVGIVKGAMRENETVVVTDLEHMQEDAIDMQTTVIFGNSKTFAWNDLMITPRGYEKKFDL